MPRRGHVPVAIAQLVLAARHVRTGGIPRHARNPHRRLRRRSGRKGEKQEIKRAHSGTIIAWWSLKSSERHARCISRMSQPIEVDLPHNLGKAEARRRIANNIHRLQEHIPGGATVQSGWTGDQLNLNVQALGEAVQSTIDVEENKVRVRVLLPGMLGMFSGLIQGALQKKGCVLLE